MVTVESSMVMVELGPCTMDGGGGGGGGNVGDVEDVDVSGVIWEGMGGHGMEMLVSSLARAGLLLEDEASDSGFLLDGLGVFGFIGEMRLVGCLGLGDRRRW